MLKQQHQDIIEIIKILHHEGEMTIGRLQTLVRKKLGKKKDFYTLKSACELLAKLEYISIDEKPDRTYVSLTTEGQEISNKF